MNPRGSKHVGDIRNEILIYKSVHFFGLCCINIFLLYSQITVLKMHLFKTTTVIYIVILVKRQSVPFTGHGVAQRVGRGIAVLFHDRGTRRE